MSRKLRIASVFLAAATGAAAGSQARATTFNWSGGGDGTNWGDAGNWAPNGVPDLLDAINITGVSLPSDPTIDLGGTRFVQSIHLSATDRDFTFVNTSGAGALEMTGPSLTSVLLNDVAGRTLTVDADVNLRTAGAEFFFNTTPTGGRIIVNGDVAPSAASGVTTLNLTSRNTTLADVIQVHGVISDGTAKLALVAGYANDADAHRGEITVTNPLNTYTGKTSVNGATLKFNSIGNIGGGPSALGAPTTVADATIDLGSPLASPNNVPGTLRYVGSGHASDRPFQMTGFSPGGVIESSGTGPLVLSGGLTSTTSSGVHRNLTLGGTNGDANTFGGVIADVPGAARQSLTKAGTGRWILTAANTYEGDTRVSQGELVLQGPSSRIGGGPGAVGTLFIPSAGTFRLDGGIVKATDVASSGTLLFGSGTLELISALAGGSEVRPFVIGTDGPGRLLLNGGNESFTGTVALQGSDDSIVIQSGGTYQFGSLDNSAGGVVAGNIGQNLQINGGVFTHNVATGSSQFLSRIQGTGGFTKQGAGLLRFDGNSHTYTGATRIEGGTVSLSGTTSGMPDASPVFIAAGATLDVSQRSGGEEIGPLSGSGTVVTGAFNPIAVDIPGGSATFAGTITGPDRFIKRGNGRQILTGQSDYTGATDVEGGVLEVGPGGSITGSSAVNASVFTVNVSGGTIDIPGPINIPLNGADLNMTGGLIRASRIDRWENGTIQELNTLNWTGGTIHLTGSGGVRIGGSRHDDRLYATTAVLDNDMALIVNNMTRIESNGSFILSGGTLQTGSLAIVGAGSLRFDAGQLRITDSDESLTLERLAQLDLDTPFGAGKSLVIDQEAAVFAPLTIAGGRVVVGTVVHPQNLILSSGTFEVTPGPLQVPANEVVDSTSGMHVSAAGGLQVAATGQFNAIGTTFTGGGASTNDGAISAINSTLNFNGGLTNNGALHLINTSVGGAVQTGGTVEVAGTATFSGAVSGSGDFTGSGSPRFEGSYRPAAAAAAQVSFAADLALGAGNTLFIELGGTTPSTQHDQLLVAGRASIDGTLAIELINGFTPTAGDEFTILSASTVSGGFASVTGREINPTTWLATILAPDAVRLAVALPGDATLDGVVNLADFNRLAANFGQSGFNWLDADFTGDGLVNLSDFNALAANFGMSAAAPGPTPEDWAALASAVPEPLMPAGALLGATLLLRRRKLC